MSEFYPSGYGYDRDDSGYVISKGSILSKTGHRHIDVWSAFTGLPPDGDRIMNGDDKFFYRESDAVAACVQHRAQRRSGA